MLLFIILPFILQTITINVYLKSHVARETYIIARIFTFFLCPVLDMFLPLIYLGSFVCFKHIKILQQVDAVEFRAFLDSYQKIHSVSESFLEALPQTLVQAYIYFSIYCLCFVFDTDNAKPKVVFLAIFIIFLFKKKVI